MLRPLRLILGLLPLALRASIPFDPLDAPPSTSSCGTEWGFDTCAFGDNAVLSSSTPWSGGVTPARLFGNATANEKLTLSGLPPGATVQPSNPFTAGADGSWTVTVASPDAPLFVNITLSGNGGKASTLHNVRFGLTILCSGQSNCDMKLGDCFYSNETVAASAGYSDIVYKHGPDSQWIVTGTDNASLVDFSAVCFFTALHMKQNLPAMKDIPIGLVQSSVGGTTIETWMSSSALEAAGFSPADAACGNKAGCGGQAYCGNFLPLIAPLAPTVFKSMIFYQGESNVACNSENATRGYYARLLPALVTSWRELFQSPFAAYVVMLAPQGRTDELPEQRSADPYPALRQAQLSVLNLNATALIYPIDMGDDGKTVYTPPSARHGDVHPRNKTEFGRRLALAYAEAEGLLPPGVAGSGPQLATVALDAGSVLLTFNGSATGLAFAPTADCYTFGRAGPGDPATPELCCQNNATDPKSPHGFPFEVEAAGAWVLARGAVEAPDAVRLSPLDSGAGALSGRVRYAWDEWPLCVVVNAQALPLPPFVR